MNGLFFDEEKAIEGLQERGYRIVKENFLEISPVTTVRGLVNYFYSCRRYYNPERKFPYSVDHTKGTRDISSFVRSRQKLGLGRKAAVAEAVVLINALFRFEEHLKLKGPIINPAILTNRPTMDRICSFMNNEVDEVGEIESHKYIDGINEAYNTEFAERDFERAAKERKRILEILNDEGNRNSKGSSNRD